MIARRTALAVPILCLAMGGTGNAQGFSPPGTRQTMPLGPSPGAQPPVSPGMAAPGMAGPGMAGPAPGYAAPQSGMGGQMPQPPPQQPGSTGRLGFAQPQPQPQQAQPRQNYADELTDFGVPPQSQLQENVASPTPTSIPGARVITTAEMRQAAGSSILFVDVLAGASHRSLPGALMMPGAGDGGSFDDAIQQKLWTALSQATQMNPNRPIAFFCAGSRCWESYNAALRAVQMGFKMVLWYRGGLAAWQAAGLPFGNSDSGSVQPGGRPGFGANPG